MAGRGNVTQAAWQNSEDMQRFDVRPMQYPARKRESVRVAATLPTPKSAIIG